MTSSVSVGSVTLGGPVMTASGTAGHGAELAGFMPLAELGAVVVKSLAAFEWAGNPAPRVHPAGHGMINAVGLQGPGVERWLVDELPALLATGATVVASIWGRSVDDYRRAADQLAAAPAGVVAVEVNLSCPNLEGRRGIFAHDAELSAEVIEATAGVGRPRWAKLSANTDRVVEVAGAVYEAGAEAVTLVNTLLGMVLDPGSGLPVLGAGGGGYSGTPIHAVAVRTVFDVRAALPDLPIVGVGGVANAWDAAELLLAGAQAVQVGTATFADPAAPWKVQRALIAWCAERGIEPQGLSGMSHRGGLTPQR
ncbi:MAG: dihydroorotate dehydrogenase [Actinomycetota bacterium]